MIKITQNFIRYELKNTVAGQYERHMNRAFLSAMGLCADFVKIAHSPDIADIGVSALFGSTMLGNFSMAIKDMWNLKPIKVRAKAIRKATKLAKKNNVLNKNI